MSEQNTQTAGEGRKHKNEEADRKREAGKCKEKATGYTVQENARLEAQRHHRLRTEQHSRCGQRAHS